MVLLKIRSNKLVAKSCFYGQDVTDVKDNICDGDATGPKSGFCGWDRRGFKIEKAVDNGSCQKYLRL